MSNVPRVGGEVDASCTKCKMLLGHTILAMVGSRIARVRCNTCQGEHNFRTSGETAERTRAPRARTAAGRPTARAAAVAAASGGDLDSLIKGKDISQPLRYQANQAFSKDEVIQHPSFGLGVVLSVRGEKLDVMFNAGLKTLAHQRGSTTQIKRLQEPGRSGAEGGGDKGQTPDHRPV
jgi:hypothetical protein